MSDEPVWPTLQPPLNAATIKAANAIAASALVAAALSSRTHKVDLPHTPRPQRVQRPSQRFIASQAPHQASPPGRTLVCKRPASGGLEDPPLSKRKVAPPSLSTLQCENERSGCPVSFSAAPIVAIHSSNNTRARRTPTKKTKSNKPKRPMTVSCSL